jgi:hypothetical protein
MRTTATFVGLAMTLATLGDAGTAPDVAGCSNASLRGSYGLHATGTITGGPAAGPFAAVGIFSFDGRGNLSATLFQRNIAGNSTALLTGTYDVEPDCMVSDTWIFPDGSSTQHESVIVDRGRGYVILNTTEGAPVVISGEARKQFSRRNEDD